MGFPKETGSLKRTDASEGTDIIQGNSLKEMDYSKGMSS